MLIIFSSEYVTTTEAIISTWQGETNIADWIAVGGNSPTSTETRDYISMFDKDISTFLGGTLSHQNRVVVTFKELVMFYDLRIITSREKNLFGNSYKSMCIVLDDDNVGKICTSADYDVDVGQEIILGPTNPIIAMKVELLIQNDVVAQIADLKIHYTGT